MTLNISLIHTLSSGCDELATVEENIVTAFTEAGGDDDNRLTVTLNRAYKVCRIVIYV
jgi:anaphase-promoting complex subunit 5